MNFSSINPRIWLGGTGRRILKELGDSGMVVAFYLISNSHANQSGVYYCPLQYIAAETQRTTDRAEDCMSGLERIGFAKYDHEAEVVWVLNMVKFQVQNWPVDKKDNKYRGVLNSLAAVPESYLVNEFLEYWGLDTSTDSTVGTLPRGFQGASKGLPEMPVKKVISGGAA